MTYKQIYEKEVMKEIEKTREVENTCKYCGTFQIHEIPRYTKFDVPVEFVIACHKCKRNHFYAVSPRIKVLPTNKN